MQHPNLIVEFKHLAPTAREIIWFPAGKFIPQLAPPRVGVRGVEASKIGLTPPRGFTVPLGLSTIWSVSALIVNATDGWLILNVSLKNVPFTSGILFQKSWTIPADVEEPATLLKIYNFCSKLQLVWGKRAGVADDPDV